LADLEAEWSAVDRDCRAMPRSLTHGDFVAKNLYVRTELDGPQILPLDWGQAGWGPPGLDLAQSGGSCHGLSANADVEAYLEVVRHHRTGIDLPQVQAWARLGSLLRTIVAVEWASRSVGSDSAVLSDPRMRGYADPLAQTVRALRGERNRRPCA